MNANSVVNLTLSITDQFSDVTAKISKGVDNLSGRISSLGDRLKELPPVMLQIAGRAFSFVTELGSIGTKLTEFDNILKSVGIDLEALAKTFLEFKNYSLTDNLTGIIVPLQTLATGIAPQVGSAFESISGGVQRLGATVAPLINAIDRQFLTLIERFQAFPANLERINRFAYPLLELLSGVDDLALSFSHVREVGGKLVGTIFSLTQEFGLFSLGLQGLKQLVDSGPFSGLIGQNIELQQQLIATQSSLAATNKITANGIELKGIEAIKALGPAVKSAIKDLEKGSLELSNVTSRDLVPVFSIVAGQAGRIGISLSQATDLTLSFSAALGTLNIPLYQANQEITSILNGTIDYNSRLAIALQITPSLVGQWKAQGVLFDKLKEKLQALRDGNKLNADSVGNLGSNIKDLFEIIQRTAGAPLLDPIVAQLKTVYQELQKNGAAFTAYIRRLANAAYTGIESLFNAGKTLASTLGDTFSTIPIYFFESFREIALETASGIKAVIGVLEPFINILKLGFSVIGPVGGALLGLYVQLKLFTGGVTLLTFSFSHLVRTFPLLGELFTSIAARGVPAIATFMGLSRVMGGGAAAALVFAQNLKSIPFVAQQMATKIPLVGGAIASILPQIGTTAIGLVALSNKFPILKKGFSAVIESAPVLVNQLALLAGNRGFPALGQVLADAAVHMNKYGTTTKIVNGINEKFIELGAGQISAFKGVIARTGLLAGAFVLAVIAVNEFVLKNKELLDTLGSFFKFLGAVGQAIYIVLTNPITYLTAALSALAVVIATQTLPSLALLRIAMLDGLVGAFEALLPNILKLASFLSSIKWVQGALAVQSFALALEGLVTAAAAGTLTAGGLTVALGQMAAAAAIALAPLALLVAGVLAIGKAFEYSTRLVESGGSIVPDWVQGIIGKLDELSGVIPVLPPQIKVLIEALKSLSNIKVEGAITPIIKDALDALRQSDGVLKDIEAAQNRTNEAKKKGIALSKEELAQNKAVIAKSSEEINRLDGKLSYLREQLAIAQDDKTKQTIQGTIQRLEARRDKLELAGKEENLKRINRQLEFAKKDLTNIKDDAGRERAQRDIDDLEKRKQKLEEATASSVQLDPILLTDFGNTEKAIADRVKAAQAILDKPFDEQSLKRGLTDLIEGTQQQLESGAIDIEEAVKRFKKAASIGQLTPEDRLKAEKALTQALKQEYEARASVYDALIAKQEVRISAAKVGEIEGEREITRLKKEQYQERLDSLDAQIRFEIALQEQRTGKEFSQIKSYSKAYKALIVEREKLAAEAGADALARQQKLLDKQLELVQRSIAKITDAITAAEVERNTAIQNLVNAGTITDTKAAELKVSNTRARIEKELALERAFRDELLAQDRPKDAAKADEYEKKVRASKLKTAQLTLQLAEEEERQQDATARAVQEAIERRTKATTNLITQQSHEYQKQLELLNKVGDALAAQNKILEQRQSLTNAISGYLGSQLKLLADTAKTEDEKIKYERAAAVERLRFLRQEQEFARQKLELSIQQQRLQDAQALRQNQIDQLSSIGEAKQSEADLKKKQADPNALPEELEALKLDLEAKQQKILIERQKGITLGETATLNRRGEFVQRKELDLNQRAQTTQARLDVAKTLPQEQQDAAIARIRNEVYQDVGPDKIADAFRSAFEEIFDEGNNQKVFRTSKARRPEPGYTDNSTGVNTYAPDLRRLDAGYRAQEAGIIQLKGNNQINTPGGLTIPISTSTLEDQSSRLIKLLGDANATLVRIATTPPPVPPPMKVINQTIARPSNGGLPR